MIQIRNVPKATHDALRERARRKRQSLSDFMKDLIDRELNEPPDSLEWEDLRGLDRVAMIDFTSTIRELRDEEST